MALAYINLHKPRYFNIIRTIGDEAEQHKEHLLRT